MWQGGLGHTQEGQADEKVRDHKGCCTVQTVGSLFCKRCSVFQEGWHVCYGHEGHECGAKELHVVSEWLSNMMVLLTIALING